MTKSAELIELIVKNGLTEYKVKNSKHKYIQVRPVVKDKQGVIFGFRSKDDMTQSKGFVMSSRESILENKEKLTHWTPNIFSWGGYKGNTVHGHYEHNLIRLNTFVLDVDTTNKNFLDELLMVSVENAELLPTAILKTPNGYHVYYVLEESMFVSSANSYKSLNVAKLISKNLRQSFAESLPGIDVTCNHFGIFRVPTSENLIHFEPNYIYSFKKLMDWSMKYNDRLTAAPVKKLSEGIRQIDEPWYRDLMNTAEIRGNKGEIGRNNTIFTCALACYSSGLSFDECYDEMDQFNSQLKDKRGRSASLKNSDVLKIIKSAYSGKYSGASKEFVSELLAMYTDKDYSLEIHSNGRVGREHWTKHAKKREDRVRVHYSEWKEDLIAFINSKATRYRPYYQTDRNEICQELGMPVSTYKDLIADLKKSKEVYVESKRGKNGYTKFATKKSIALTLVRRKQTLFTHYMDVLERYFEKTPIFLSFVKNIEFKESAVLQGDLFIRGGT